MIHANFLKKHFPSDKSDFSSTPKRAAQGAAAGALVGGVLGAANGYQKAVATNSSLEKVTLSYEVPTYQNQEIGEIAADQYIGGSGFGDTMLRMRPVHARAPVQDAQGALVTQTQTETFEGLGEPVVTWNETLVEKPTVSDYTSQFGLPTEDGTGCIPTGKSQPDPVGDFCIKHTPILKTEVAGSFKTPSVEFKPVDVQMAALKGALGGAVIGTGVGVLAGVLLSALERSEA